MNSHSKEIAGSVIAALGTLLSAIGTTPFPALPKEFRKDLDLFGNTLQAAGNSLEAGGQGTFSLELIGNELQAIGNVTVIAGLLMDFEGHIEDILIITGNWTQALGGLVALADEFEDRPSGTHFRRWAVHMSCSKTADTIIRLSSLTMMT